MKRHFSIMILMCALLPVMARAQAPQIADTVTFKDTRTAVNSALSTLHGSKAAPGTCPANQYAIQTTTAGVVCAGLLNHAGNHGTGGIDPVTPASIGAEPVDANIVRKDGNGNVVIGTSVYSPATSEPTCNSSKRGYIVRVAGTAGVADTYRQCIKGADDAYAWATFGSGGAGASTSALNTWTRTQTFAPTTDETAIKAVCANGQTAPIVSVFKSDGSTVIMQANCDGTVTMGSGTGPQTWTAVTVPGGNPSPGQLFVYADNSSLGLWSKDENGIRYRMVKPLVAVGGTCVTGMGADGVFSTASCGSGGMIYPSAGIPKSNGSAWTASAYTDITALWTSCSSGYLKFDGTCSTPAGGGGATIPSTANIIKGDGAGNGADAGFAPADVERLSQNQTVAGNRVYTGIQDASGATHTTPAKTGVAASKPATCAVGEEYFASDSTAGQNKWYCTATNTWTQQLNSGGGSVSAGTAISVSGSTVSVNPFDNSTLLLVETFCAGGGETTRPVIGTHGWSFGVIGTGTPTVAQAATVDENHPCGINSKGPATASNGAFVALLPGNGTGTVLSDVWTSGKFRPTEVQIQFRLSSTANIRFYAGLDNKSASALPTAFTVGCYLRYDTTLSDTGWIAGCGDGSAVGTASVTGTLDTNPHRLRMWTTAAGTFNFSIDGGATATVSKTMPTGTKMALGIQVSNDGTSTTSAVDIYRAAILVTGLAVN